MTKSIISGLGLLAVVMAILLGVAGVYEMSEASALAMGFVGFVFAIFFARFGGFKPFFPPVESATTTDELLARAASTKRLVGVGAEHDSAESLFGDRSPRTPSAVRIISPTFGDDPEPAHDADEEPDHAHTPLFGEALSEQLAVDRAAGEQHPADGPQLERTPAAAAPTGFVQGLQAGEEAVAEDAEQSQRSPDIQVEVDPGWVGAVPADREDTPDAHDQGIPPAEEATETAAAETVADETAHPVEAERAAEPTSDEASDADAAVDTDADTAAASDDGSDVESDIDLEDLDAEELVEALDALEQTDPSDSAVQADYVIEPTVTQSSGLAVAAGTDLPVVVETPAPLELHKYSTSEIMSVVKSQESVLVDTLIEEGVLSTTGPLTDKDIRTMVFVAVSSNELIEVLTQAQQEAVALDGGGEHALGTGD